MQLAADDITLQLGRDVIRLRPTLRAALRLERRHGFPVLLHGIADGNLGLVAEIIREASGTSPDLTAEITAHGLGATLDAVTTPCLDLVAALVGHEEDEPGTGTDQPDEGERVTFREHHERLFRIATGALGWTPDTAWNATPAEILAAYQGRREIITDVLTAIYGPPKGEEASDLAPDEKLKVALENAGARLGTRVVKRVPKPAPAPSPSPIRPARPAIDIWNTRPNALPRSPSL